jgi:FtsH-binding integral membrane protein
VRRAPPRAPRRRARRAAGARLEAAPLAPWLGVAGLALLAVGALHLALGGPVLHALWAWLGVATFAAYTLHDVARLLRELGPDDAVEACLHLYLDVLNLALLALECAGGGAAE